MGLQYDGDEDEGGAPSCVTGLYYRVVLNTMWMRTCVCDGESIGHAIHERTDQYRV